MEPEIPAEKIEAVLSLLLEKFRKLALKSQRLFVNKCREVEKLEMILKHKNNSIKKAGEKIKRNETT